MSKPVPLLVNRIQVNQKMMKKILFQIVLLTMGLIHIVPVWGDWQEEAAKINFLLDQVGRVDGYFVRNGKDHSPESAVAHMRMKMDNAMDSWFAPDKDQWTAEMFIDKIASTSSLSGKPYQIRFKSGKLVNTGEWLHECLKEFNMTENGGRK